ncbi:dihydrofolate reductase [bacterium]|nr:MAG: dihydrofolate reductase [bacterium]
MKRIIVAYDQNRTIGKNGQLPWQGELPADMRHFRTVTAGHTVIMGRKTFDSIGKALPKRHNIVVSRSDMHIDEALVASSLEQAYSYAIDDDIYVLGGGQVYAQALDDMDEVLATEIHASFEGDAHFPALGDDWVETMRQDFFADDDNKYDYSFVTYTNLKRQ